MQFFKPTLIRPEIVAAIASIHERYHDNLPTSSIEFPPRYGKSTVIRGSALELRASGAPLAVCLCPWRFLADQIKDEDDITEMLNRYDIKNAPPFSCHRVEHISGLDWFEMSVGVPTLLSMTVGLALINKHPFLKGIEYCAQRFNARPVAFFDESQVVKKAQSWGGLAIEMQDHGCYIVTLTGTPVPGMPGFEDEVQDIKNVAYALNRPRRNQKGEKEWFKEEYEGKKSKINIRATKSVSWNMAWLSKPPALEQVNAIWVDTHVYNEHGVDFGMLSEIKNDEVLSGFLRTIIESDEVTNKLAYAGVDRLLQKQRKNRDTRMLVVTGADIAREKGSNQHARKLKAAIRDALIAQGHSPKDLRIVIATSVDENGDPDRASLANIERFRAGGIDILIVKMMGLVGLDVPELKVLVYAGAVRDGPQLRQALSRPLTVWDGSNEPAALIMPCDPKMRHGYDEIISKQGGTASSISDVDLVRETPIPEPPPKPMMTNQDAKIFGYSDHTGRAFSGGDHEYILKAVKEKWIIGNLTDVEILDNYAKGGFPVSQQEIEVQKQTSTTTTPNVIDLDANLDNLRGKFGEKARKIVNKYVRFVTHSELWRLKVSHLQAEAKDICRERRPVPKIDDAVMLQKLIDALDQAEVTIFNA